MKKIVLSKEQLDKVIRLRQEGRSWLFIEDKAKVARRVAQRAHADWEKASSAKELGEVRRDVARNEFEQHLNLLTWLDEGLVEQFARYRVAAAIESREEPLQSFWQEPVPDDIAPGLARGRRALTQEQVIRRNLLLFRALQKHTREGVDWRFFDNWTDGWRSWHKQLPALKNAVRREVGKILRKTESLGGNILGRDGDRSPEERLDEALAEAVCLGLREGNVDFATGLISGNPVDLNELKITMVKRGPDIEGKETEGIFLLVDENDMKVDFVTLCRDGIRSIWRVIATPRRTAVAKKIREAEAYLTERLDTLLLRPMIIRTRCDLCPV